MTLAKTPIQDDELMALIDGVLEPQRAHQIEQQAKQDAGLAAMLTALRAQQQALRASLDPVLDEPIPRRLLQAGTPARFFPQHVAAALVWVTIGISIGGLTSWQYFSRADSSTTAIAQRSLTPDLPRFVRQAAIAHTVFAPEVRRPVEVGSADLLALNTWLSKRLQRQMQAPNLSDMGFSLVGGRLLPAEINKPAAQFMYENRQGQRLTVYLRGMAEPTAETAFRFAEQGFVNSFYWVEREWGYALSGELARPHLLKVARAIHEQLSDQVPN